MQNAGEQISTAEPLAIAVEVQHRPVSRGNWRQSNWRLTHWAVSQGANTTTRTELMNRQKKISERVGRIAPLSPSKQIRQRQKGRVIQVGQV
jgi:hypothetical protein